MKRLLTASITLACATTFAQNTAKPLVQQGVPDEHAVGVDMRGDHAMGFSHEKTKHHFELLPDGGVIQVDANSDLDNSTRDQIRMHLTHIAAMFRAGNFDVPMFIHDTVPPGVPVMKEKHDAIRYAFASTPKGARVRIVTHDPIALKAVHEFLKFQIDDHRTGDSESVKTPS
jgi:hypothetical protein